MNHDPSNPFHKLAKAFAAGKEGGEASPRKASPGASSPPRPQRASHGGDSDDAALFLDAVSSIKPLPGKKAHNRGAGELLAERMLSGANPAGANAGAASPSGTRQPGAKASVRKEPEPKMAAPKGTGPKVPPAPAASGSPAGDGAASDVPFASAMHDLFSGPAEEPSREEDMLFAKAMHGVSPVSGKGRDVTLPAGQGRSAPAQDPAKALRDVLEGRVEFALHHTDEFMEGYVVGVDPLVLARLRGGQYSPEKHLDMHGMNARQAYDALTWFIRDAYQRGLRCVVVVTGRGRNSPDGVGVLRPMLQRWLSRDPFKRVVLAFCTARPGDGGPGAAYVLLRKYKKSRGKIIWDHTPSDEEFPDM